MRSTIDDIKELLILTEAIGSDAFIQQIDRITELVIEAYKKGNKTLFCGNGGSSAEAQHLAAELSGKFKIERRPIPADRRGADSP